MNKIYFPRLCKNIVQSNHKDLESEKDTVRRAPKNDNTQE